MGSIQNRGIGSWKEGWKTDLPHPKRFLPKGSMQLYSICMGLTLHPYFGAYVCTITYMEPLGSRLTNAGGCRVSVVGVSNNQGS